MKTMKRQQTQRQTQDIATWWLAIPFANSPSIEAITDQAETNVPVQCVNSSPAEELVWALSTT